MKKDNLKFIVTVVTSVAALGLSALSWAVFGLGVTIDDGIIALFVITGTLWVASAVMIVLFRHSLKSVADSFSAGDMVLALRKYPVFDRTFSDYSFRSVLLSAAASIGNLGYIIYLIVMAASYRDHWYASLVGFYGALWLMRIGVLAAYGASHALTGTALKKRQWIIYLSTGVCFPVVGGVIAAPVIQMAIGAYPAEGSVFDVAVSAVFAAVKLTVALTGLIRAKNRSDEVVSAVKNIGLVSALMSLNSLQVSIIRAFANGYTMWEWVSALGGLVAGFTVILGVYMIVRAALEIKKLSSVTEPEE